MNETSFRYLHPHPCVLDVSTLLQQCEIKFTRRGGPGGQHRNKTQTAVVLTHLPTGISGEGSERRSQNQNREVAIHRLRVVLALMVRTASQAQNTIHIDLHKAESVGSLSEFWEQRIKNSSDMVSAQHWDFPIVLAYAIDHLALVGFELSAATQKLDISTGQLSKLLRQDGTVLAWVNLQRQKNDLGRIR